MIRFLSGHLSDKDVEIINKALEDTRKETLKAVGEWLKGKVITGYIMSHYPYYILDDVEILLRGEMPK